MGDYNQSYLCMHFPTKEKAEDWVMQAESFGVKLEKPYYAYVMSDKQFGMMNDGKTPMDVMTAIQKRNVKIIG